MSTDAVWALCILCLFIGPTLWEAGNRFLDWTDRRASGGEVVPRRVPGDEHIIFPSPRTQRERDDDEMRDWLHTAMVRETEPSWPWPEIPTLNNGDKVRMSMPHGETIDFVVGDPPPPGMIDRTVARTREADRFSIDTNQKENTDGR